MNSFNSRAAYSREITNRITEEEVVEGEGDGVKEEVGGVKVDYLY